VAVALQSGVAPGVWLDDPRALYTAAELINDAHAEMSRHGR
jgi:hypothetical protein